MRLIIIGDLSGQVATATMIAQKRGAKVAQFPDIDGALNALRNGRGADLIMINVRMNVKRLVDSLTEEHIHIPVVGCGINASGDEAVRAIKAGAKEYVPLPPDEEMIAAMLQAVTEESTDMVAGASAMTKVMEMADQVAPSEASILITGESGTGKEVIARYIHTHSKRAGKDMISVNCAAIPENLLESELFGHEKGAFTGAVARRIGKFEEADGSTLLLDEISEMDLRLQAKLLRAIQEREITRVGSNGTVKVNIRVLATSNRDLQKEVKEGRFREDLFFRLNVIHLHLPPLRERKTDIRTFAEFFAKKYAKANGIQERKVSDAAIAKLDAYAWPGNVRELENTMHRAVLLAGGNEIGEEAILLTSQSTIGAAASSSEDTDSAGGLEGMVGKTMESVERELITRTLERCLGNRTHAANMLGISIRTLRNKLNTYQQEAKLG